MRRIAALLLLAPFSPAFAQPSLEAGEKLYGVCAGCHGSVSGREIDAFVTPDALTGASRSLSATSDPVQIGP